MTARTTHQSAENVARLKKDVDRIRRDLKGDASQLEQRVTAIERYLTIDLYPWLELVEATVATGTDPPEFHP